MKDTGSLKESEDSNQFCLDCSAANRYSVPGYQHANDMTAIGLCTDVAGKNKYVQNIKKCKMMSLQDMFPWSLGMTCKCKRVVQ